MTQTLTEAEQRERGKQARERLMGTPEKERRPAPPIIRSTPAMRIVEATAKAYGITRSELYRLDHGGTVSRARAEIAFRLRTELGLEVRVVARMLHRSGPWVVDACNKHRVHLMRQSGRSAGPHLYPPNPRRTHWWSTGDERAEG